MYLTEGHLRDVAEKAEEIQVAINDGRDPQAFQQHISWQDLMDAMRAERMVQGVNLVYPIARALVDHPDAEHRYLQARESAERSGVIVFEEFRRGMRGENLVRGIVQPSDRAGVVAALRQGYRESIKTALAMA